MKIKFFYVFLLISLLFFNLLVLAVPAKASMKKYDGVTFVDPISAILTAFHSHNLVAIDEGPHGNEQNHQFLHALVIDPRFINKVNDIVVEFGNSLYQPVMDRFVQGDNVSINTLRQVWQNTTQANDVWDKPVYEDLFKTVRAINTSLPKEKKLRVILSDPPIDRTTIHNKKDMAQFYSWQQRRDIYAAKLIQQEVLNKHRRALIIYGGIHLQHKNIFSNYEEDDNSLLVSQLEKSNNIKVYTIWMVVNLLNTSSRPLPVIIPLRETKLGKIDFSWYYPYKITRGIVHKGKYTVIPPNKWRVFPMENQFDAIIYLGNSSNITISQLSPTICLDSTYIQMRMQRMALSGAPQNEIAKFKKRCSVISSTKKITLNEYLKSENATADPKLAKWWKIPKNL